jgi:hydroxymethylpyrimidine pyrophosphatase-like HAD family hydrolase
MYRSALPWAQRLGISMPLVCYQGALVREIDNGSTLQHVPLDQSTAKLAIEIARRHGWHRQAYVDDELLCEQDREEVQLYSKVSNLPYRVVDDLVAAVTEGSTKIVCGSVNAAAMHDCLELMARELYGQAWVTMPVAPFCEIVNPNVSKSKAVDFVLARYGLSLSDAVAFGDGPNDTDLLEGAAIGVAVVTGHPRLVKIADMTCSGPDDGGVGEIIDRLGLLDAAVAS